MKCATALSIRLPIDRALSPALAVLMFCVQGCSSGSDLQPWHIEALTEEFTADMVGTDQVRDFDDYLALEDRLFRQLDDKIYADSERGPAHILERYSSGSAADPEQRQPNWNRSFELTSSPAIGGVLLLHGMSDSPYSMRSLAEALNQRGYHVIGLRSPGHGTAPSGLRRATWQDMAAAVRLGVAHLDSRLGSKPVHIIGYSTGATLALDFALNALDDDDVPVPASLVLMSPAIRVHPASGLAGLGNSLAVLPGLDGLAYLDIMDEFDPYKYNSFATNAAAQVHLVTRDVDRRIQALAQDPAAIDRLPRVLVLKSTVDATVTTDAVVTHLLMRLAADRNELVLFDINRNEAIASTLLVDDPGPLTNRLMANEDLPFAVTFVTNEDPHSARMVARHKPPFSAGTTSSEALGLTWPRGVVSLSHVALPFPPDDPVYGLEPPEDSDQVFLGNLAIKGERGVLKIPESWLLRLRFNPFHSYMQTRVLHWLEDADAR